MSCVFRLEKWLLIDIRGMADGFWSVWKVFFIKRGWGAEKSESNLWKQGRF